MTNKEKELLALGENLRKEVVEVIAPYDGTDLPAEGAMVVLVDILLQLRGFEKEEGRKVGMAILHLLSGAPTILVDGSPYDNDAAEKAKEAIDEVKALRNTIIH